MQIDEVLAATSKKEHLEELFDVMIKVRKRDPSLKNKEVEFFTDEIEEEGSKTKKKKKKSEHLKDVLAKQLLEHGAEPLEEEYDKGSDREFTKSYNEEQEQNRLDVLKAARKEEEDDDEELLIPKGSDNAVEDEEVVEKIDDYFGPEKLDENAEYLRDYFKYRMWLDKGSHGRGPDDVDILTDDEMEIEIEIEKQEEYEYRFQENAGDQVLGHAREVEGSVRKNKEERMEIARLEREEELRHLKNLKKKENTDKLKKIMKIAGIKKGEESLFDSKDLEKEFDPEEYDRMMKKAFSDEYYGGEIEKPDFDKEDELLGLPNGLDDAEKRDGFLAAREKILELKKKTGLDTDEEEEDQEEGKDEDEEGEEEKLSEEGKKEKKRKLAILERAKKEMWDEYYKLDYEGSIWRLED